VSLAAGFLLGGLGLLAACAGQTPTLQGAMDELGSALGDLLGAESLPGKFVQEIYAIHEDDKAWRFRADADEPLERCCAAIRGLGTADYGSWREAAVVTRLVTAMSDEHPSSLVRAESLDTLAKLSTLTTAEEVQTARRSTEEQATQAMERIAGLRKGTIESADVAGDLAEALNTIAGFRFDQTNAFPAKLDQRVLARESHRQLVVSRRALRALTGGALDGHDADPRVREALDRALVTTCAAAIRLAHVSAASGAQDEIVRAAAVRDLEITQPEKSARILGVLLANDDATTVRREAARALGAFPEAECVPELIPALADDRSEVRAAAAASLNAATGQPLGDDRVAWTRWWQGRIAAASPAKDGPASPERAPR
jgi:HEAT repeat protein